MPIKKSNKKEAKNLALKTQMFNFHPAFYVLHPGTSNKLLCAV